MAAESFDIELRLINGGLIGPAKQSADALKALETQMDKTSSAFEDAIAGKIKSPFEDAKKSVKGFEDEVKKAMAEAAKLASDPKGFQMLAKARKDLADQRKKLLVEAGVVKGPKEKKQEGFMDGLFSWAQPYGAGRVGSAVLGELVADGIEKGVSLLIDGFKTAVSIFEEGFKRAFQEGSKFETLKIGYKLSLRGKEGRESMEDVGRFAGMTGFDDDDINRMLLPLRRAGASRDAARSAFAAATDIAAGEGRGGDMGRVQGLLEGFNHILLKGGVQERRLPEMGVDVKKFYADLAKTLNTTAESAKKLAEEGKVNPQLLLNTIYKGVTDRQGGPLGTGGIEYGKSMEARLSKLGNLPSQYLKTVAESPEWDAVSEKFGSLLADLDPDSANGRRIVHSIMGAFGSLADVIHNTFTAENIDHFVKGMETVVSLAGTLASYFGSILDYISRFSTAFDYLNETKGPGKDPYLAQLPTEAEREKAGDGFRFSDLLPGKGQSIGDWLDNGNSDVRAREKNITYPQNLVAKAPAVGQPSLTLHVNVNGAVDPTTAKATGKAVGEAAGAEVSKHFGRMANEAGAR